MKRRVRPQPMPEEPCPACPGKRRYKRLGHARQALRMIQSQPDELRERLQAYKCRACGFYHLGRPKKEEA